MKTVNMYTDGACAGNQNEENVGGWGCILEYAGREKELHGGEENTTNNRMELSAPIAGLSALKEKGLRVRIFSDSSYLVNCFQQGWYHKWLLNGWKTAGKKPVENRELWEQLLALTEGQECEFYLVKGHLKLTDAEGNPLDETSAPLRKAYDSFCKHNGDFSFEEFYRIAGFNNRADDLANEFIRTVKAY
ncbi:MAG: ribonuclease HI [Firmicutes bacterium]|nr:ribonuclease HI [Bacillota bacterium]